MNQDEFFGDEERSPEARDQVMLIPPMQPWPPVSILDTRVTFWPLTKYLVKLYFASVLAGVLVILIWTLIAGALLGALIAVLMVLGSLGGIAQHV